MVLGLSQQAATETRAPCLHPFRSSFGLHTQHPLATMAETTQMPATHPQLGRVPAAACYWQNPEWVAGFRRAIAIAHIDEMARAVQRAAQLERVARAERAFVVAHTILAEDEATAELACARACEEGDAWLFTWGLADTEWLARAPTETE